MREPIREIFQQIDSGSGPASAERDAFRSFRRGEITFDDYLIQNARFTAEKLGEYQPCVYLPMPSAVRDYVVRRLADGDYDRDIGIKLGSWVAGIVRASESNQHDVKHLLWAFEKCLAAKLGAHAIQIERHLARYAFEPPNELLRGALRVQERDAREREGRG